jgi:plastocyanin domain-containing protein
MTMPRVPILVAMAALAVGCKKQDPPPAAPPPTAEPPAAAPAPKAAPAAAPAVSGRVEVAVTEEGFVPSRIPAKAGQPLVLAITRKAERTCATEILFHGQEGKTDLPLNKTVEVTYVPKSSGPVKFGCAMGMMIGGVIDVSP